MDLYVVVSVSFRMGMMISSFHICGMVLVLRASLYVLCEMDELLGCDVYQVYIF